MSPVSTGIEIASVSRIHRLSASPAFLERVFTESERSRTGGERSYARLLAGRFAAKEAVMKALGAGWGRQIGWKDIEVMNSEGRPRARLRAGALKLLGERRGFFSISCAGDLAVAMAVIE